MTPPTVTDTPPPSGRSLPSILDADIAIEDDRWHTISDVEASIRSAVIALVRTGVDGLSEPCAMTIALSNDAQITALNATFRDKTAATNVLSFPAAAGATEPGEPHYLGDIIIAFETVTREADEQGIAARHHLQHLVIHGVLHLLGYDHVDETDATIMEAIETAVLASLGIADPYADLPSTSAATSSPGTSSTSP